uniref:Annexin n=1 Tax=Gadus morhua TaxID=8049 RepID=A0A8C5ACK3_GADMO
CYSPGQINDASANFKMADDVSVLRKAMEGLGTTEKKLVDVLTQRSNAQRLLISDAYQKATGRALIDDLKSDTGGDFEDVLVALVTPPDVYDCREIISAIKGAGTTESVLTEMFASRTNKQIVAFSAAYLAGKRRNLTQLLPLWPDKILCYASSNGKRDESTKVDAAKAKADAKILYEAGEKKWGTDESKFVDILCHSSVPQLRQTMVEYKSISKKSLQESIEGEMSGNLEDLLVAIVKCAKSTPTYLAERLFKGMKGPGTTESILTRIIVSRSELDLLDIRADYKKLFGTSLYSALTSEVSGDYGECLKRLCGGED